MQIHEVKPLVEAQRAFFATDQTFPLEFRKNALKKLLSELKKNQQELLDAVYQDFGKGNFESFVGELFVVYTEINYMLKNMDKLAKKRSSRPPAQLMTAKTYVQAEPYGLTLIFSPWNFPVQLALMPLVASIAAGNCAILKTSRLTPHSSAVMKRIIDGIFPKEYVCVIEGASDIATELLAQRYDFIFYTGSPRIGKVVMEAAAKHLTPMCLELGGKSPALVLEDANLDIAAKRIVFGKTFNGGQVCIAPDYVLVHESLYDKLAEKINFYFEQFVPDALNNPEYPRVISDQHFNRLMELAEGHPIEASAQERRIKLTIIHKPALDSKVMQEEIFGPLLPMVTIKSYEEALTFIREREKPLATYLFTESKEVQEHMSIHCACGGLCINDTILHFAAHNLPFGGVGTSGMGSYHGKYSFDTFSHLKPVVNQSSKWDFKFRYPPYSKKIQKIFLNK